MKQKATLTKFNTSEQCEKKKIQLLSSTFFGYLEEPSLLN